MKALTALYSKVVYVISMPMHADPGSDDGVSLVSTSGTLQAATSFARACCPFRWNDREAVMRCSAVGLVGGCFALASACRTEALCVQTRTGCVVAAHNAFFLSDAWCLLDLVRVTQRPEQALCLLITLKRASPL